MIQLEKHGPVRLMRLESPGTKNALDLSMAKALEEALAEVEADTHCRAFVLTGMGRVFSAGPDVAGLLQLLDEPDGLTHLDEVISRLNQWLLAVYTSPKLSVAAINGYAFGGGFSITFPFDYRIALERAAFIENFYRMGLTPDLGASYFLPRLMGPARAAQVLWTGQPFMAPEAAAWGLLHEVVASRSALEERALEVALSMAEGAPEVIARTRELLRPGSAEELQLQLQKEKASLLEAFSRKEIVRPRLEQLVRGAQAKRRETGESDRDSCASPVAAAASVSHG